MSGTNSFTIKTEVFEGPLDLLLNLIEKRKLLINDIALSKVTDDFIAHINKLGEMSLSKTSHFILIASTLLLIKSKSLLPTLELSYEEEQSIDDLERRLKLYKRMKELSLHVIDRFGKDVMYEKLDKKIREVCFAPSEQITFQNMYAYAKNVLKSLPKVEKIPEVIVRKVISLEATIKNLTHRIKENIEMSFREFAGHGKENKINVIVSFLAMLELVKQGIIDVEQNADYEDIKISSKNIGTPKY